MTDERACVGKWGMSRPELDFGACCRDGAAMHQYLKEWAVATAWRP